MLGFEKFKIKIRASGLRFEKSIFKLQDILKSFFNELLEF